MEVSRRAQDFNCKTCAHHHCDETGEIECSKGPAPYPKWVINGEESRTCPLPQVTALSREMLRLHLHYRAGHLPLSGGVMDQPAGFLRAMEIIESVPVKRD